MLHNPTKLKRTMSVTGWLFAVFMLAASSQTWSQPTRDASIDTPASEGASFVGNSACEGCHQSEAEDWKGSHHDLAMQEANSETVLGNFDNATFDYAGVTSTFFKKGEDFWVRTDNPQGELEEFPVPYVFGVYPLQQYLVPLSGGRLQALSIAWDARPKTEGGQRWYHLYPDEAIKAGDPLHWTGPYHNWNTRCAECHSTNVRKQYDTTLRTFDTVYDQIDVGCEACHGPGREHVAWATQKVTAPSGLNAKSDSLSAMASANSSVLESSASPESVSGTNANQIDQSTNGSNTPEHSGFPLSLAARGQWSWAEGASIAHRSTPLTNNTQIDTCARCHARRSTLGDYHYGADLLDTHRLSVIEEPLYWADGQIRDEVYVYGSFIQSKMHQAGVVCANCHNPHSNELRATGNALCAQCHQPATYDTTEHHHHPAESAGAQCVDCHMPAQVYMGVDWRRDHSMRIPRPDLSQTTGAPNACTQCHDDKSNAWAVDALANWGQRPKRQRNEPARAFHSAYRGDIRSLPSLKAIIDDPKSTPILKASAIEKYGNFGAPDLSQTAAMLLGSEDALVRASAVRATAGLPPRQKYLMLRTLMDDDVLAVRMAVAEQLAATPMNELRPKDLAQVEPLFAEYESVQSRHLDMPSVQLQMANYWRAQGDLVKSEAALREALRLNPQLEPAIVNLTDLLRETNREDEARKLLESSIAASPAPGTLQYTLGLLEIRAGNTNKALSLLKASADSETEGSRHRYVYAIALHDTGKPKEAFALLERLNTDLPGNPEVLYALIGWAQEAGDVAKAGRYQGQLQAIAQAAGLR